ncbi:hypothetical protein DBB36_10080 [Flavobacterium sp. WLB]|uniref:hypothetical protein n=1 Tax=Flavobacterium sp. WLB TaxID=2161662 RepID=UPI000D3BDC4B|nr:hypothetical protein [Flavobacterium sp. WLB]PUU70167.1 hypothetical protein DBB36_10080 [Flavobacterium sp. WLB]
MKIEIKEISKLPSFIFVLFGIQLIVFLCLIIKREKSDWEIFYVLLPVTMIFTFLKMTFIINAELLQYKLTPFHFSYKKIMWKDVEAIKISKIDALSDFLGWGVRYSRKYGWSYIFNSNDIIFLKLKSGKKITFTIKNK